MLVIDISSNDHKLLFFLMSEERDLNANVSAVSHRLSSMTDERDLLQANLTEKTKELEGLHFLFNQSESLYELLCVFKKNLQTHINLFFFFKKKENKKKESTTSRSSLIFCFASPLFRFSSGVFSVLLFIFWLQ